MHSAQTFCCDQPYESVSGGDWSLHRGGAVVIENATDATISNCVLDHPEGNGIVLNGYSERIGPFLSSCSCDFQLKMQKLPLFSCI